jgi:hypothetical protein
MPVMNTTSGRGDVSPRVRRYCRKTSAKRGPLNMGIVISFLIKRERYSRGLPAVIAMSIWKTFRSGYQSPMLTRNRIRQKQQGNQLRLARNRQQHSRCRYGRKPFLRVPRYAILHNLLVMQRATEEKCSEECGEREVCMCTGDQGRFKCERPWARQPRLLLSFRVRRRRARHGQDVPRYRRTTTAGL